MCWSPWGTPAVGECTCPRGAGAQGEGWGMLLAGYLWRGRRHRTRSARSAVNIRFPTPPPEPPPPGPTHRAGSGPDLRPTANPFDEIRLLDLDVVQARAAEELDQVGNRVSTTHVLASDGDATACGG